MSEILLIVDDDVTSRDSFANAATVAHFEPVLATDYLARPQDLIKLARSRKADGVLCDHKLKEAHLAGFDGAEGAAQLNMAGIPAFLVTRFEPADVDMAIRPFRRYIPQLLHKRPRPKELRIAFEATRDETVKKKILPNRRPYRTSLFVEELGLRGGKHQLRVSIPQWDANQSIPILLDSIPNAARGEAKVGGWLLADVNLNATCFEDLYLDAIRLPPKAALQEYYAQVNRR